MMSKISLESQTKNVRLKYGQSILIIIQLFHVQ